MIVYTERLVDSSTEASVYGGATGSLPADGKSFLEKIDSCLWPIREEGWFWEGRRKSRKTKHVICHHPNMLSHSYLQTHPEGVLHISPGWTHEMFINDIAYRFSSRYTHRECAVPFLGGMLCTMRFFNCAGVLSCQKCSPEFRMKGHTVVDPRDADILDAVNARSPLEEVKKKVLGIYLGLEARKKSVGGFCTSRKIQPDGSVKSCEGGPKVIPSFTKPGAYFLGCTGYSKSESEKAGGSKGNRHYASSLNLRGPMVEYLQKLISGEETLSADDTSACHYIKGKHKGRSTCPKHGCKLIEIPCRHYPNDKVSAHIMVTIEPHGYHEKTPDEKKVLYVSCVGEHLHPPPPPETTVMKMRIFEHICAKRNWTSLAQLRQMVQCTLLDARNATGSGAEHISLFDGAITIPSTSLYRRLRMLRPPVSKLAVEVGELCEMAANPDIPYVRDMRIADEKFVFILGLDEQFLYVSRRKAFAGDAAYKTVTESNRSIKEGHWYLYNIVANTSDDLVNSKGIVVMRALMTGLSTEVYETVWTYFFKAMSRARGVISGAESIQAACLKVPNIELPPLVEKSCCRVSSITIDFNSAELHGCCDALRKLCGGTREVHTAHIMIGCSAHLVRDIHRKTNNADVQRRSGMDSSALWKAYHAFVTADSAESAEISLKKIDSFDEDWVKWVRSNDMGPVICHALSQMDINSRNLGFKTTNAVESQNRRGNVLAGTHLRPSKAARKLWDIDRVDCKNLAEGVFNQIVKSRGYRTRSDSLIRPSGSATLATRKRAKKGGGPAPLKKKKKAGNVGGSMSAGNVQKEASREQQTPTAPSSRQVGVTAKADITNLVQQRLTDLLGEVGTMPVEGGNLSPEEQEQKVDKRTDIIIDMLHSVNEAGGTPTSMEHEFVKKILLDGMKMESVRKDKYLRDAFVAIFRACMRPSSLTSEVESTSEVREEGNQETTNADHGA